MSSLTLIRHGQASFAEARYDELTDLGIAQSRALGDWARERAVPWSVLRHGPRRRQADTAHGLVQASGLPLRVEVDHGLDEFAEGEEILGAAAGLCGRPMFGPDAPVRSERLRCYESAYQAWARGELSLGGRPAYPDFRLQVRHWLDATTGADGAPGGQQVAVVTSAGVISAVVCEVLGLPDAHWTALMRVIQNASMTEVLFSRGRRGLRSFNCSGHLPERLTSAI